MTFDRPFLLIAGFIALGLSLPLARLFKDAFTLKTPLGPPGGSPFKTGDGFAVLMKILRGAELVGFLILFAAAAEPLLLTSQRVWLSRGADIVFTLDISPSMACLDMNGKSRFDAARKLVKDFAERRPSDAIGLVCLGKDAALFTPPTVDRSALFAKLDALRLGELGDGTALGMGLAVAGLHLSNSTAPRKAVVLITDGENNAGAVHPETAASIFPLEGVNLWVIAVGSSGQIPIDYTDPFTKVRRTGLFESRFNPENIKSIAAAGEGIYFGAPSSDMLVNAFMEMDKGEMTITRSSLISKTKPLYGSFLLTGLFILLFIRFVRRCIVGIFL
ncbi:MAG: VWA domain-containing protein [Treponema sp.]|jgi:Ca-activated chloride channel family protein|nr:VWA domain-containing protein [Treponema sp.]